MNQKCKPINYNFLSFKIAGAQPISKEPEAGSSDNIYENASKIQRSIAEGDLEFVSILI